MIMTQNASVKKNFKKISLYKRVDKRIRYNYFRSIQLFKRELMYGTWVYANHLCHMTLVAKPERDTAQSTDIGSLNVCKFNNIFDQGTRLNDKKRWKVYNAYYIYSLKNLEGVYR